MTTALDCRIVDARVAAYRRKLARPLVSSAGTLTERRGFLLRLSDADGVTGHGEASPVWWAGGESLETTQAQLARLCAAIGAPGFEWQAYAAQCPPAVAAAFGSAVLDLTAHRRRTSVAQTIDPRADCVVETNALATAEDLAALGDEAGRALAQGFRTLKLKVGAGSLEQDIERVRVVRSVTNGRLMLRLDANRAWDPETARRFCAVVADADIDYVEEPLRRTTPEDLATLRSKTGVRIALDESISTAADLDCYVTAGSCDAVVLKLTRIGTPYVFIELAARATSRGIGVTVTDSLETEIGQRIALHLAAAIGARSATGLAGSALLADATLDTGTASRADGLPRADGPPRAASEASMPAGPMLQISGPGLGMSEEALARVWDAS